MGETRGPHRCIRHPSADHAGQTWCGRTIDTPFEWVFQDTDHAALTAIGGDWPPRCADCVRVVVAALTTGEA